MDGWTWVVPLSRSVCRMDGQDKTRQDKTDEIRGSKAQLYWDVIGMRGGVLSGGLVALVA